MECTSDRTKWPSGPWDNEPDKLNWIDPATGMDCMIVRNHMGALCGYVAVTRSHRFYGKSYDDPGLETVCVHGGLSYADACNSSICHAPEQGRPDDVWWFGFDCCHGWDAYPSMYKYQTINHEREIYRDIPYVKAQCERLAAQLAAL
jgi:hypothetical protein